MEKRLELKDDDLLDELLSIFGIGLTYCLEKDLIDNVRAEQWLFSPVLAYNLNKDVVNSETQLAIEQASELQTCHGFPDIYMPSVLGVRECFAKIIKESASKYKTTEKYPSAFLEIFLGSKEKQMKTKQK